MLTSLQNKLILSAIGSGLLLGACGSEAPPPLPADTLGLRATAQIATGVSAKKITVIPNTTAGWTSQILLLANGQVSRTRVDGGQSQAVNAGDVKDIIGLKRESAAGVALTLTPDGTLRALIEKDDEGRLGRMNVSAKAANYSAFCQYSQAPSDTLMVINKNTLVTLGISYEGNDVITLREISRDKYPAPISACLVKGKDIYTLSSGKIMQNKTDVLSADNITSFGIVTAGKSDMLLTVQNERLVRTRLGAAKTAMNVAIEDGLSIGGTDKVTAIYTTSENLGGTFNRGTIALQDGQSDRLVLIANSYAARALTQEASKR